VTDSHAAWASARGNEQDGHSRRSKTLRGRLLRSMAVLKRGPAAAGCRSVPPLQPGRASLTGLPRCENVLSVAVGARIGSTAQHRVEAGDWAALPMRGSLAGRSGIPTWAWEGRLGAIE